MFDEFVHVNNVFLSPDVAGFIVHGQDAAEAFSMAPAQVEIAHKTISIREGCKKTKWKFKMAFAMKAGGVLRGSRVPHTYFEKKKF